MWCGGDGSRRSVWSGMEAYTCGQEMHLPAVLRHAVFDEELLSFLALDLLSASGSIIPALTSGFCSSAI